MRSLLKTPAMAAFLSFVLPGLGQAAGGKPRRGGIVAIPAFAILFVFVFLFLFARHSVFDNLLTSQWLTSLLILDIVAAVYHVWAVVDAYLSSARVPARRGFRGDPARRASAGFGVPILAAVLIATVGVHFYFGIVDISAQNAITCVFNPGAPCGDPTGGNYAGQSFPDYSAPPDDTTAQGSPSPAASLKPGWIANTDGIKVRTGPGTNYTIVTQINKGTTLTGQIVAGGQYDAFGTQSTDWIKIDDGQAQAGNYVAKGFFDVTMVGAPTPPPNQPSFGPLVYPTTTMPPVTSVSTNWQADGYLNVLLVGADSGAGRADLRTDTMILLQVKIATGQAAMYGIPRNLFNVPLPPQWQDAWPCHCFYGYSGAAGSGGNYMLNALWQWAAWRAPEKFPLAGGYTDFERGFKVLEATVGQLTGVTVDGVVYINLLGFVKLIDDLGGLDINVPYRVYDATMPRPDGAGTYVLDIPAGQHHFDGVTALAYVRSRHQADDTQRMARQQAALKAIRSNFNPCQLLPRIPSIMSDLGGLVWTDLPQGDAPLLAALAQAVGGKDVQSYSFIPQQGYAEYVTPDEVKRIHNVVAHGLDSAPKSTTGGSGGGGGGGLSC